MTAPGGLSALGSTGLWELPATPIGAEVIKPVITAIAIKTQARNPNAPINNRLGPRLFAEFFETFMSVWAFRGRFNCQRSVIGTRFCVSANPVRDIGN